MSYLAAGQAFMRMRIAVIDMGTNTFHLLVVDVHKNDFRILYREKAAVKIGENGINQGMITEEASRRAITTLKEFKKIINDHQANEVFATATSAIRNARNGEELVDLIRKETGISTHVISGMEEAEYIYFGVNKALNIGEKPVLIMDIGGGSIEFIIGTSQGINWCQSFEIGGLRMVEKFHKHDPILPEEIVDIEQYLTDNLADLFEVCHRFKPETLIGSSGTFDTLSDIYRLQNAMERSPEQTELPLDLTAFHDIHEDLLSKSKEQRLKIPGMIPLRVDMIVVASALIKFVIDRLQIKEIRVSAYALKEGVLLNTLHALKKESLL